MFKKAALLLVVIGAVIAGWSSMALACGGFFCQNDPVDQTGERIVFTVNDDDTVTSLIEILYQGSAEDFSWILPIPEAIDADALAVPDRGQEVFDELHQLTDVQFVPPATPECAQVETMDDEEEAMEDEGVQVFSSGEVGPFGFDIIGSDDPNALIDWLRDTNYLVTPEMEPLINVYVEEESAFIAMRLLDGETAESIEPIEITYPGNEPVIPLRLTAVAAQPDLPVWVWVFGDERAVPTNFAEMELATEEITFFPGRANDYIFLVQQRADALDGHAFITEYAQPIDAETFRHPWLSSQVENSSYLTRLHTYLDPEEMTVDPTFGFDGSLGDVDRIRDGRGLTGLYSCERDDRNATGPSDAIDPEDGTGQVVAFTPDTPATVVEGDTPDAALTNEGTDDNAAAGNDLDSDSGSGLNTLILLLVPIALLGGLFLGLRLRK